MLTTYVLAVIIILGMLGGWITIQHLARLMAAHHPELGPAREEGGGCGLRCACSGGGCVNTPETSNDAPLHHSTAKEPS